MVPPSISISEPVASPPALLPGTGAVCGEAAEDGLDGESAGLAAGDDAPAGAAGAVALAALVWSRNVS